MTMKLNCSSCGKLVADIELAKVSKNIVCYCAKCDATRSEMIHRLELLMSMNVNGTKHGHKKHSFKDVMNEYFNDYHDSGDYL